VIKNLSNRSARWVWFRREKLTGAFTAEARGTNASAEDAQAEDSLRKQPLAAIV